MEVFRLDEFDEAIIAMVSAQEGIRMLELSKKLSRYCGTTRYRVLSLAKHGLLYIDSTRRVTKIYSKKP